MCAGVEIQALMPWGWKALREPCDISGPENRFLGKSHVYQTLAPFFFIQARNSHLSLVKIVGADRKGSFSVLIQYVFGVNYILDPERKEGGGEGKSGEIKLWALVNCGLLFWKQSQVVVLKVFTGIASPLAPQDPTWSPRQCFTDSPSTRPPWRCYVLMKM